MRPSMILASEWMETNGMKWKRALFRAPWNDCGCSTSLCLLLLCRELELPQLRNMQELGKLLGFSGLPRSQSGQSERGGHQNLPLGTQRRGDFSASAPSSSPLPAAVAPVQHALCWKWAPHPLTAAKSSGCTPDSSLQHMILYQKLLSRCWTTVLWWYR